MGATAQRPAFVGELKFRGISQRRLQAWGMSYNLCQTAPCGIYLRQVEG